MRKFYAGTCIGNLEDQIIHGSVTDFLFIDFRLFQTGNFNMAYAFIVSVIFIIILNNSIIIGIKTINTPKKFSYFSFF
ncbi:MAG: signal peptidase II [Bacteroidetes bacterium]|uniref:signal peptidase II n=1 Tax=Daejeonella sp. TaxID=2805397 RepID=UPI0040499BDB|nr:signal peptidase II [Bacteroidota bacterium]